MLKTEAYGKVSIEVNDVEEEADVFCSRRLYVFHLNLLLRLLFLNSIQ